MVDGPYIAEVAALIGDPARANMLAALLDGRAFTATELAMVAGITPQTASGHLAKLTTARLISVESQGRHRYFRLAGPEVAGVLEGLMTLSVKGPPRHRPPGPRDETLRYARTCYDHLAGTLGVSLAWALVAQGVLDPDEDFAVTESGAAALADFGLPVEGIACRRRPLTRRCLDWSERRPHLGGALAAALLDRFDTLGWVKRLPDTRAVTVTAAGRRGLRSRFGVTV